MTQFLLLENGGFLLLEDGSRARTERYSDIVARPPVIGGGLTLDLDEAAFFAVVLTENVSSLVIAHPPPPDRHGSFILFLTQGGAGNYEVAWPATVRWGISGPPTAKQVGLTTVLYFSTPDGGVPWYAFLCGLFI